MKGTKEIKIFIQGWIYRLCPSDDLTVFTGLEAQYDSKRLLYRESEMEYKLVAESIPALADARRGDLYRVVIREELHSQYGYQWKILSAERIEPVVDYTIRTFLMRISEPCLTPKRADALIKAYGAKTFDAILAAPSALDVIKANLNSKRRIYHAIADNRGFANLLSYLAKRKWDCRWAIPLYERHKDAAILQLRTNPYLLCEYGLAGFKTADWVFLDDGGAVNAPLRCHRAVMAALHREAKQNGGTFIPREKLRERIAPLLGDAGPNTKAASCTISEKDISDALSWLEDCAEIHIDHVSGKEDVYIASLYDAEMSAAKGLKALCQTGKRASCPPHQLDTFLTEYSTSSGQQLTSTQRLAVKQMLTAPVSIVTGGPGTGKTFLIEAAIAALRKLCPHAVVQNCAPTGKAADCMPAEASTIARLSENAKWKRVNRSGTKEPDIVIVDEVSMVGITLFAELLDVVPRGARLVLIGDQNQLPSIQPGQVLRDLIASGVIQTVQLKDVFRQKENSAILSNSEKIIQTPADQDIHLDKLGAGFAFNKCFHNPHKIPNAVIRTMEMALNTGRPLKEIQVITRRKDEARNLNHLLQDHFNPQTADNTFYYGGKEFRLNDRVIHIKNNYDKDVFNGEVGAITEIQHTKELALTVKYPSKTIIYSEKDLAELELAYALTAHKCQGSEYNTVVIPIAGKGISRRWLYTAETRGRQLVLLIGTEDALSAEMRDESSDERASHLALRLRKLLPPVPPDVEQLSMFTTSKN